jgi:thiol-disulfide isomerase/thioredoxin
MFSKDINWLSYSFLLAIMPLTAISQTDPQKIVDQVIEKRLAFESVTYDINFKMKRFSYPDTLDYLAKVELVRKPEDTLFHGLVLIDLDTIWYGYDGEKIFSRNLNTNEVVYDNALTSPGLFIKSNIRNNLVDEGFLKISRGLKEAISNPEYYPSFMDTTVNGRNCFGLYFSTPDEGDFTDYNYFAAIDPDSSFIRKIVYSVYYQGNEQYQEWNYSNVHFGHDTIIPRLDFKTFGSDAKEIHYLPDRIDANELPDYEWALLSGKIFNREEGIKLNTLKSHFIILDFWYTSCYPCIKSIPSVNNIANHYAKEDVTVYGVNMIDNEVRDKAKLDKFFTHNTMAYPTIMLDKSYQEKIPLAYPTFLILNDRFEVVFQEVGFHETLFEDATQFLDKKLMEK